MSELQIKQIASYLWTGTVDVPLPARARENIANAKRDHDADGCEIENGLHYHPAADRSVIRLLEELIDKHGPRFGAMAKKKGFANDHTGLIASAAGISGDVLTVEFHMARSK